MEQPLQGRERAEEGTWTMVGQLSIAEPCAAESQLERERSHT